MRKAFTLIELLIVMFIIALMAVLAVPAFDRYGARANLDAKAEEIQELLRSSYQGSKSPILGSNGVRINIVPGSSSAEIDSSSGNLASNCLDDPVNCLVGRADEQSVFFNVAGLQPEYTLARSSEDAYSGSATIIIKSPGEGKDVHFYNGVTETNLPIKLDLIYAAKQLPIYKKITITQNPFNVEVQNVNN